MDHDTCEQWHGYLREAGMHPEWVEMHSYLTPSLNRRWKLVVMDSLGHQHDIKSAKAAALIRQQFLDGRL